MNIVVVGGGISGLAAAWQLSKRAPGATITVLESDERLGGKIQTSRFADRLVDTGPDAFLARHPAGVELCRELGLFDQLQTPTGKPSLLWTRGALRALPRDTVLGVPSSVRSAASSRILSRRGVTRLALDYVLPRSVDNGDVSVAEAMTKRLGREASERFVEPLIGGINAGVAERLSLQSTAPQIQALRGEHRSLLRAARASLARRREGDAKHLPLFYATPNGMATLIDTLTTRLRERGVVVRTSASADALRRDGEGWSVAVGDEELHADRVLITTPAHVSADLLHPFAADASGALRQIAYASVAMIRLAYQRRDIAHDLEASGYLSPSVDDGFLTACSFASSKWTTLHGDTVIFRASAGRINDTGALALSDAEIIARAHAELAQSIGARAQPIAADVTRWTNAFPQYEPGHRERVEQIAAAAADLPGLELAGAYVNGLGVPACIATARAAVDRLLSS